MALVFALAIFGLFCLSVLFAAGAAYLDRRRHEKKDNITYMGRRVRK